MVPQLCHLCFSKDVISFTLSYILHCSILLLSAHSRIFLVESYVDSRMQKRWDESRITHSRISGLFTFKTRRYWVLLSKTLSIASCLTPRYFEVVINIHINSTWSDISNNISSSLGDITKHR
jgi:hypothetical protein